jgi:hypothetical protein
MLFYLKNSKTWSRCGDLNLVCERQSLNFHTNWGGGYANHNQGLWCFHRLDQRKYKSETNHVSGQAYLSIPLITYFPSSWDINFLHSQSVLSLEPYLSYGLYSFPIPIADMYRLLFLTTIEELH